MARSSRPLFSITKGIKGIKISTIRNRLVRIIHAKSRAALFLVLVLVVAVGRNRRAGENVVDQSVFLALASGHVVVAIGVLGDSLQRLAGVLGQNLVEHAARLQDFVGLNLDVRNLAADLP